MRMLMCFVHSQSRLSVQILLRCSYITTPHPSPSFCNHMHQHVFTGLKYKTLAAIPLFGNTRILHTMVATSSTAQEGSES